MQSFKIYILLLSVFAVAGCKKYLEQEPNAQTPIKTTEDLEAIVNNARFFALDGVNYFLGNVTDHTELPSDWSDLGQDIFFYTFSKDAIAGNQNERSYSNTYRQIFIANVVLTYVDRVEGDAALKAELKADGHFIRAYAYWYLANAYCLPYAKGKTESEPGMTLKSTTDYEEPLQRATLKQTYDFILADLNEAMETSREDVDPKKPWRVSKKAVAAVLSRVHLTMGNYEEALSYANTALGSTRAQLVDYRTIKASPSPGIYTNPRDTLKYSELKDWREEKWLYWEEFYLPRMSQVFGSVPSPALLSLYDQQNDLRFKWFMIPKFNRVNNSSNDYYGYVAFQSPTSTFAPTGPTVGEMLLNKAEVLARKGDLQGAMAAVNTLRTKRLNTAAPLSATDRNDAVKKVIEERRREMPFSMRWYDIRRFSVNDDPTDDVTVSHTYWKVTGTTIDRTATLTYTLAPGSRQWALPIPDVAVTNSKGATRPNEY
jgi:starch-binding outer membrane protein, SusD/RagB family